MYINWCTGELMYRCCTDALLTIQSSLGDNECAKYLKEDFVGSCCCLFFGEDETRSKRSDGRIKKRPFSIAAVEKRVRATIVDDKDKACYEYQGRSHEPFASALHLHHCHGNPWTGHVLCWYQKGDADQDTINHCAQRAIASSDTSMQSQLLEIISFFIEWKHLRVNSRREFV